MKIQISKLKSAHSFLSVHTMVTSIQMNRYFFKIKHQDNGYETQWDRHILWATDDDRWQSDGLSMM